MQFHVTETEQMRMSDGREFAIVRLDIPYHRFLGVDSALPRPTCRPHHETLCLRVRATRPDGSTLEPLADISFVDTAAPASLAFADFTATDVPVGTQIELLRYERHAMPEGRLR
jgi:hypothetical protein